MAKRAPKTRVEPGIVPTVHQNFFLKRDQMEIAESIVPGATERMLKVFELQQKHDQKMDEGILELHRMSQFQERSDSWKAFILVFGILIAVLYLLINGQLAEAGVLGTVFVGLAAIGRAFRRKS